MHVIFSLRDKVLVNNLECDTANGTSERVFFIFLEREGGAENFAVGL